MTRPVSLTAEGVTFGYSPSEPLLQGWSAEFEPGSMTAITGPSGRGKSTLLYLLGLMLCPSSGEIRIGGVSTTDMHDSQRSRMRAQTFGFVFQDAALDSTRTILDNVTESALYRGEPRRAVTKHAQRLLENFGVDVPADRRPGQVSGGQAQRISLCRALLSSPAVLLADEPTGNLDPATSALVINSLYSHAKDKGATVVIVTHSPEVAALCDREVRL